MNTKEAIVLAGGLGTRLQDVLPGIPKCMAPVYGKPFLTYLLDYLAEQQINKVILSVGFCKSHIIKYFGESYNSMLIEYAIEDRPLGTGGAAKLAFNYCRHDQAYILNGDTYFQPDLSEMEKMHFQFEADITMAVKKMPETARYGKVETDGVGRITGFCEKNPEAGSGLINGGIYLVEKHIFDTMPRSEFSLENDVFRAGYKRLKIQAFQSEAYFLDIGIPEDFEKAQNLFDNSGNK